MSFLNYLPLQRLLLNCVPEQAHNVGKHTISAAVKQTGTSVIVACGLAEHSNGKAACPHHCLCVSKLHLSSTQCMCECAENDSMCMLIVRLSATVCGKAYSHDTTMGHMDA